MFLQKIINKTRGTEKDLFEKFVKTFGGMKIEQFDGLDHIPEGLTQEEMIKISEIVNQEKQKALKANALNPQNNISQLFLINFLSEKE